MGLKKRGDGYNYSYVSGKDREYEFVYGITLDGEHTNDILYVMDMNTPTGALVTWIWGVPNFYTELEEMEGVISERVEKYESENGF